MSLRLPAGDVPPVPVAGGAVDGVGRGWRSTAQRGSNTVELTILTPILLIVIALVIQFAMYFHARHVAQAAAKEGARVARSVQDSSWRSEARQRTREYLDFVGGRLLQSKRIVPLNSPGTGERGMRITGTAVQVIPFLSLQVEAEIVGPRECFRRDDGDPGCG